MLWYEDEEAHLSSLLKWCTLLNCCLCSWGKKNTGHAIVLTLLMPSTRRVMCVCLQPWPPFLPHTAGPWAPLLLTKTWRAPECSPGTLCLNDRHKSPAWATWPSGRIRCAAFPSVPLGSEMVRYRPPAKQKAIPSLPFYLKFQDQTHKHCERNKTGLQEVLQVFSKEYYSWNMHCNCHRLYSLIPTSFSL